MGSCFRKSTMLRPSADHVFSCDVHRCWGLADLALLSVCPVLLGSLWPLPWQIWPGTDTDARLRGANGQLLGWLMSVIKCKYSLCFFVFSNFCKYIILVYEWFAPISCSRWWAACNACRYSLDQLDLAFRMGTQKNQVWSWMKRPRNKWISSKKSGCSETRQ